MYIFLESGKAKLFSVVIWNKALYMFNSIVDVVGVIFLCWIRSTWSHAHLSFHWSMSFVQDILTRYTQHKPHKCYTLIHTVCWWRISRSIELKWVPTSVVQDAWEFFTLCFLHGNRVWVYNTQSYAYGIEYE